MIKLRDDLYVDAAAIVSIKVREHTVFLDVKLTSGESYSVPADYGKSVYTTMDRLVAEINKETT